MEIEDHAGGTKVLGRTVERLKAASRHCLGDQRYTLHQCLLLRRLQRSRVHSVVATSPDVYTRSTRSLQEISLGPKDTLQDLSLSMQ